MAEEVIKTDYDAARIIFNRFIWLNALTAFHSIGSDNMLPVLLQTPSTAKIARSPPTAQSIFHIAYGYGTDPGFTGLLFSVACIFAIFISMVVYPRLAKTKSHLDILRFALLAYPVLYLLYPFTLVTRTAGE